MIRSLFTIGILFGSTLAVAELLPEGRFRVHQSFGLVNYNTLFAGDAATNIGGTQAPSPSSSTLATQSGDTSEGEAAGGVMAFLATSTFELGIPYGFQLSALATYKYMALTGDQGNRQDGDIESGISEIGLGLSRALVSPGAGHTTRFSLIASIGFRAPGNAPAPGDDFLALNDGSVKYDVGLGFNLDAGGIAFQLDNVFTARSNANLFPQFRTTLSVPLAIIRGMYFGPFGTFFTTFGGVDIGDSDFQALASSQGAPPFSEVKEEFISVGGFLAVPVSDSVILDGSVQSKVMGRNSDNSLAGALGVGYNF